MNTLYFDEDGALIGHNTDHYGMTRMLEGFDLAGKTALVQAQPCSHGACLAQATLTIQLL